jgi:hypothetical protein
MAQRRRTGGGGSKRRRAVGGEPSPPPSDYLLDAARQHWPYIVMVYQQFEDKKPVMLFDIQEQRIYAYPYADFSRELSERSQQSLKEQYEKAVREDKIVVFVRDNEQRRLVSFSMAIE